MAVPQVRREAVRPSVSLGDFSLRNFPCPRRVGADWIANCLPHRFFSLLDTSRRKGVTVYPVATVATRIYYRSCGSAAPPVVVAADYFAGYNDNYFADYCL
jgi:hypothetical protein